MRIFSKLFGSKQKTQNLNADQKGTIKQIDLKKVYPRIKGIYDDQNREPGSTENSVDIQLPLDESPIFRPFSKGIAVFYMLDKGNSFQIIQNKHLTADITIDKLHDAALTNMAIAISDKTEVNGDPNNVMMVTNGGNFEATMLLADFLWEQLEPIFNDKVCVAIPTNDLMFIAAKNNQNGRETLRQLVKHYFDDHETKGLIVRNIYERKTNGWVCVETV